MSNPKAQYAQQYTERLLYTSLYIFLDTCFLMDLYEEGKHLLVSRFNRYLITYDKHLLLPYACLIELKNHLCGSDPLKARQAEYGLRLVMDWYCQGRLSVHEDSTGLLSLLDDDFADPILEPAALVMQSKGNVLVLTQDEKVCKDLLIRCSAKYRHHLFVASVSRYGWLKKPNAFYEVQKTKEGTPHEEEHA